MIFGRLLVAALAATLFLAREAWAQPVLPDTVLHAKLGSPYPDYDFYPDMKRAKAALHAVAAGHYDCKKPVTKMITKLEKRVVKPKTKTRKAVTKLVKVQVPVIIYVPSICFTYQLAIKRPDRRAIEIVLVDEDGNNTKGLSVTRPVDLKGVPLPLNGVNTEFIVNGGTYIVLALRREIPVAQGYEQVTYVPYSRNVNTSAMRKRGWAYLLRTIDHGYDLVSHVPSKAFGGKMVTDAIPKKVIVGLALVEHVDAFRLLQTSRHNREDLVDLVNEALVLMGANESDAFSQARSSASAQGLLQFTLQPYKGLQDPKYGYPEARLIEDFASGVRDHANAVAATVLLADQAFENMPNKKKLKGVSDREWHLEKGNEQQALAILAASHNWGWPKVMKAYGKFAAWSRHIPEETKRYLSTAPGILGLVGLDKAPL